LRPFRISTPSRYTWFPCLHANNFTDMEIYFGFVPRKDLCETQRAYADSPAQVHWIHISFTLAESRGSNRHIM
jgi:hypothetical protein